MVPTRIVLALVVASSALSGCGGGPVAAREFSSPDSIVRLDPILEDAVGLPETAPPMTSQTADGRLSIVVHLQNQTDEDIRIQYQATFYDENSVPVDIQLQRLAFLKPNQLLALPAIASTSDRARRVTVEVRPAR